MTIRVIGGKIQLNHPVAEWATLRQKIIPTTHLCIVVHRIDSGVKGTFDSTAEIRLLRI